MGWNSLFWSRQWGPPQVLLCLAAGCSHRASLPVDVRRCPRGADRPITHSANSARQRSAISPDPVCDFFSWGSNRGGQAEPDPTQYVVKRITIPAAAERLGGAFIPAELTDAEAA